MREERGSEGGVSEGGREEGWRREVGRERREEREGEGGGNG